MKAFLLVLNCRRRRPSTNFIRTHPGLLFRWIPDPTICRVGLSMNSLMVYVLFPNNGYFHIKTIAPSSPNPPRCSTPKTS